MPAPIKPKPVLRLNPLRGRRCRTYQENAPGKRTRKTHQENAKEVSEKNDRETHQEKGQESFVNLGKLEKKGRKREEKSEKELDTAVGLGNAAQIVGHNASLF